MRLAMLLVLAGCQKDLVAELPDAALDAAIDAPQPACPTPAQPLALGAHKVFVNTEGAAVTKCASDNAPSSCSFLVAGSAVQIPAFLPGMAGRTNYIAQIVAMAQATLAPYSIDLVTTRPTSGDFIMIVVGGSRAAIIDPSFPEVVVESDTPFFCQFQPLAVDFIFDRGTDPTPLGYADTVLSDLGALFGGAASTEPSDCMCRLDPGCAFGAGACTYGANVHTSAVAQYTCGRTTQDEPAMIKAAVGCR